MAGNFCPNCGTAHDPEAKFCATCGYNLEKMTATADEVKRPSNSKATDLPRKRPEFSYHHGRHSEIVTKDDDNGEPVVHFRNLHVNAIWLFFFNIFGKTSILFLLFTMTAFIDLRLAVLTSSIYFLITYIAAYMSYRTYEFEISTVAVHIQYGILHKYHVYIAFDQIQNINIRRSVVDRVLGLSHLSIETAGTSGDFKRSFSGLLSRSEGYIPGITPAEGQDLMDLMMARIQED